MSTYTPAPLPSRERAHTAGQLVAADLASLDGASGANYGEYQTVDPRELFGVIKRRWLWMLVTITVVLAIGLVWTLSQERQYAAYTDIFVRQSTDEGLASELPGVKKLEELATSRSIATQMRLLRSPDIVTAAMAKLPTAMREEGFRNSYPQVNVVNAEGENVITIAVNALTPQSAADMANRMVDVFIEHDLMESRKTTDTALAYVRDELSRVGNELHGARKRLSDFESQFGVVGDDGSLRQYSDGVEQLENAAVEAQRDALLAEATMQSISRQLSKESRRVVNEAVEARNPVLDRIDMQIQTLEEERGKLLVEYVPTSPEVRRIDASIATARERRMKYLTTMVTSTTYIQNPIYQELQQGYLQASTDADTARIKASALRHEINRRRQVLAKMPALEQRAKEYRSELSQLEETHTLLNGTYQQLRINQAARISNVRVLSKAYPSPAPVSPNIPRGVVISFAFGLVLALCLAILLERGDDRVHTPAAVERLGGYPVLAQIPRAASEKEVILFGEIDTRSPILEGIRLLRSSLYLSAAEMPRVLGVTSTGPAEGKSTIAINLAISMAMDGKRVVLVDADLRRPSLYEYFHFQQDVGLTDAVQGKVSLNDALFVSYIEGLTLLPTGTLPKNPPELLNARRTREIIAELAERFDAVILDAPPAAGLSDTLVISTLVDGLLLVVSAEQTHSSQLQSVLRTLQQVGAPIIGYVYNKVKLSKNEANYYSYYQAYVEGEGQPHRGKSPHADRALIASAPYIEAPADDQTPSA